MGYDGRIWRKPLKNSQYNTPPSEAEVKSTMYHTPGLAIPFMDVLHPELHTYNLQSHDISIFL